MALIFDLETDGLLVANPEKKIKEVSQIHCIVVKDTITGKVDTFTSAENTIEYGLDFLVTAQNMGASLCGHNIVKYDIPVIHKLYPQFQIQEQGLIDTLILSRLLATTLKDTDIKLMKAEKLPSKLYGSHSLEAWGYRLGNHKGNYSAGWEIFSQEMLDYCIQDIEVTASLLLYLSKDDNPQQAIELEHQIACLMAKQERNGFCFNEKGAVALYTLLAKRRGELDAELREYFGSWVVKLPDFIPKVNNKARGYVKGVAVPKEKEIMFNPSSRDHISNRLITLYTWEPVEFTEGGKPQVDEVILGKLPYPPCKLLTEYLLVQKRISQLSEGDQAWMKLSRKGKIYGSVNTNGAVTGRATHAYPNISQVPSGGSAYGHECRALFGVPVGWSLMGADASGLELRCLAHFMARYDGGAYGEALLNGDIHTTNMVAAGLTSRPQAKTFIYGFLYGAGDGKIGSIVNGTASVGKKLKAKFLRSLPALSRLSEAVKLASGRGYLTGLDGRRLHVRSSHSALNTLLQSAGALVCKKWLIILEEELQKLGLKHSWEGDYAFCAWSHDEVQIACRSEEIATVVASVAIKAVTLAGEYFNFRCSLAGEFKIGKTWRDTH